MNASPVTEKTIRTRVIPASEVSSTNTTPDFWDYIESLKPEQWSDHVIYLYREDPKVSNYSSEPSYVDKFSGTIDVRPGVTIPMDDRGMIEHAIREKHGGKAFRLICKKGKERITIGKCVNDAPPRYPDLERPAAHYPPTSTDAGVASKALDVMAAQQPDAVRLAMDVLRSASDLVMRQANPPQNPPAASDSDLDRAFKQAMLERLLHPPDPFEMFMRFKQLMGDSGNSSNAMVEKVLSAAVERFMNPPSPAASGRTTLMDLGREFIPVLGNTVRETMHEFRLAREADARIAELSRGIVPAAPVAAVPALPATAVPQPAPNPPAAVPQAPAPPSFQWVAERVANIVKNMDYSTDEAVDRAISFLYDTDERLVGLLLDPPKLHPQLKPGKEGLVQLFTFEPALAPCMVNTPRVLEFIDKFLAAAKIAEADEANQRAIAATKPA